MFKLQSDEDVDVDGKPAHATVKRIVSYSFPFFRQKIVWQMDSMIDRIFLHEDVLYCNVITPEKIVWLWLWHAYPSANMSWTLLRALWIIQGHSANDSCWKTLDGVIEGNYSFNRKQLLSFRVVLWSWFVAVVAAVGVAWKKFSLHLTTLLLEAFWWC